MKNFTIVLLNMFVAFIIIVCLGGAAYSCMPLLLQRTEVAIQTLSATDKKNKLEQNDNFYVDYDKCTDGKEDCMYNEDFFGDTYFMTGSKNLDETLDFDYSNDPID